MKLNKYAKIILIFGSILTVLALTASASFAVMAGKVGNYYVFMRYSQDFLILMRQYTALTAVGVAIIQIIYKPKKTE